MFERLNVFVLVCLATRGGGLGIRVVCCVFLAVFSGLDVFAFACFDVVIDFGV